MTPRRSSELPQSAEIHPLGQVAADTHADNVRHAYLRAHFMNALLTDARITELFDQWGERTGLYRAADTVALAAADFARDAKLSHWMDPIQLADDEADRVAPLVEAFETAAEQFWSMLEPGKRPPLTPRPSAFVRDTLKLRWSWLAYELVDSFFRHVSARAFGARLVRSFTVVAQSPPAPRLALHVSFETIQGETVTEARARLLRLAAEMSRGCRDALRAMEQAERKAHGRRPKQDTSYLRHWAEWFYRAEVKQPADNVSALAREYSPEHQNAPAHALPRRRVQIGIASAKHLLSQGVYEIRE
jgi:hypothetical protein